MAQPFFRFSAFTISRERGGIVNMSEKYFHHLAHQYLNKNVEIITTQGEFNGELLSVHKDIVILRSFLRMRNQLEIIIRIDQIVAFFHEEQFQRDLFNMMPHQVEREESSKTNDSTEK